MMGWLAERGVEYVEQPLKQGEEEALVGLFKDRALPIFVDESCRDVLGRPRPSPTVSMA